MLNFAQYFIRSEGRTRDVHSSSLLIDVYALFSDVSLRRQASMTQAEKFPTLFCSRAMLICSIIWLGKRMLRVVVLRVLFFGWHEVALYSVSLICIVWSCLRQLMWLSIRYLRHNSIIWRGLMWLSPTHVVYDNHYHFTGPFRWKKGTKKNIVVSSEP